LPNASEELLESRNTDDKGTSTIPGPTVNIVAVNKTLTDQDYYDLACNMGINSFQDQTGKDDFKDFDKSEMLYELAFVNLAYDLTKDTISHLPNGRSWRKPVLQLIAMISKKTCPDNIVPDAYLSVTKNLYLYYWYKREKMEKQQKLNSGKDVLVEPTGRTADVDKSVLPAKKWHHTIKMLHRCAANVSSLDITKRCGYVSFFFGSLLI